MSILLPLIFALFATPTLAQIPLSIQEADVITPFFTSSSPDLLPCSVHEWTPKLDFSFRFDSGYAVRCRVGIFGGKKNSIGIFARVTPAGKTAVLLAERFDLPGLDKFITGQDASKARNEFKVTGAFAVGEGDYGVEILVIDEQSRTFRKRWPIHIAMHRFQRDVSLAIAPLSVEPLFKPASDIVAAAQGGWIRLTVLLDTAPINPRTIQLHAWDRAFLIESLYSLLRQTPYKSVRVVAFNLEQQREIFRRDHFDGEGFLGLIDQLRGAETGTVSTQALENRDTPKFLINLVSKEMVSGNLSDAVVFLGPTTRPAGPIHAGQIVKNAGGPHWFYFEYSPTPGKLFPDGIEQLTKTLDGKVYLIHSPAEFERSIDKMLSQLKRE
ncbi:MAG: hypothetical protein WB762_34790 [Candidatus Sulfotelmatobacter sp.]